MNAYDLERKLDAAITREKATITRLRERYNSAKYRMDAAKAANHHDNITKATATMKAWRSALRMHGVTVE